MSPLLSVELTIMGGICSSTEKLTAVYPDWYFLCPRTYQTVFLLDQVRRPHRKHPTPYLWQHTRPTFLPSILPFPIVRYMPHYIPYLNRQEVEGCLLKRRRIHSSKLIQNQGIWIENGRAHSKNTALIHEVIDHNAVRNSPTIRPTAERGSSNAHEASVPTVSFTTATHWTFAPYNQNHGTFADKFILLYAISKYPKPRMHVEIV